MKEPYYDAEDFGPDFESGTRKPPDRNRFHRYDSWSMYIDNEAYFYWWNTPSWQPSVLALQACILGWKKE